MDMLTSINPTTEEIINTFDTINTFELNDKINRSHNCYLNWKDVSINKRADLLLNLAKKLKSKMNILSANITSEMGKPIAQSIGEIEKCAWLCEFYAERTEEFLKSEFIKTDASESYARFDPVGVILGVMPWNFPYWQVFRFAVPAIAAGNTALIKHAPNVSIAALEIEKLFLEAGFPIGALQSILIAEDKVHEVISNCYVKGVSVTASERAGAAVASQAGKEIKKCVLELGGSDPFIVLDDANIDQASEVGAASRLFNSGQTCISAKRFIAVESIYDEFLEKLIKNINLRKIGDPMNSDTDIGPLARIDILKNMERQIDESVNLGAKLVAGGGRLPGKGYFFRPVVLVNITNNMPVYTEETFGPTAVVIKSKDSEDAARIANDTKYGLGASLWTENIEFAKNLAGKINAGHISINSMVKSDPRLPFGGINRSGYGRELSYYGLREFTNIKSVWIK